MCSWISLDSSLVDGFGNFLGMLECPLHHLGHDLHSLSFELDSVMELFSLHFHLAPSHFPNFYKACSNFLLGKVSVVVHIAH